jgi:hypothetical protein
MQFLFLFHLVKLIDTDRGTLAATGVDLPLQSIMVLLLELILSLCFAHVVYNCRSTNRGVGCGAGLQQSIQTDPALFLRLNCVCCHSQRMRGFRSNDPHRESPHQWRLDP